MLDARRTALAHLIDHAPLFPPASPPMPDALEEDRRARAGSCSFFEPVEDLQELGIL